MMILSFRLTLHNQINSDAKTNTIRKQRLLVCGYRKCYGLKCISEFVCILFSYQGLTLVPAHQHVPVQSNRSSEITLAQTAEMLLLKLASFLKTTGAPGENGPPVHQLAQAQEAEIDLIFVITQETLQLKFAPSQVRTDPYSL